MYRGQPVAAIAATGLYAAEDAIDLIEVEYEVLPPVMSIDEAIAPDAPILHDPALTEGIDNLFDPIDGKPTNIARQVKLELGDLDAGFGAADVVIEREYSTSTAHQGYIEPHTATAHWNQDGQLTVWTATQGAFGVRDALAGILKHPVSRIRVIPTEIGGGFGGKLSSCFALLTALLSKQTGRPVQLSMNRTEVFEASGPTSGHPLARQARRHPRRQDRRRRRPPRVRGRRLPAARRCRAARAAASPPTRSRTSASMASRSSSTSPRPPPTERQEPPLSPSASSPRSTNSPISLPSTRSRSAC